MQDRHVDAPTAGHPKALALVAEHQPGGAVTSSFSLDAAQFVWELCGIYLSHHAAQRFLKAPDADRRARTAFEALIERAAPAPRKKKLRAVKPSK